MKTKKVIILSGGFDPIHSGHVEMFKNAREQADFVIVCLNSDDWLKKKKGINFLDFEERSNIIRSMKYVDEIVSFEDDLFGSVVNGIKKVIDNKDSYQKILTDKTYLTDGELYCEELCEIEFYFGNGGDRNSKSTPSLEQKFCEDNGIGLIWGLGGNKSNSSSWILNRYRDWHFEMTDRAWGNYKVVYQDTNKKVKIIEVMPNSSLSLQSHDKRSEHWVVVEGTANVIIETEKFRREEIVERNESIYVPVGAKHKLTNNQDSILQIVEVQIGDYLGEDDIVRFD